MTMGPPTLRTWEGPRMKLDTDDPLDVLLERLTRGDAEAAETIFLAYEPVLRIVVRRMLPARLRSRFDSMDIVQSVWTDLLRGFRDAGWRFANREHLRAFLIKATRNRYLARQRKHRPQLDRQRPLAESVELCADTTTAAGPVEQVQAKELWDKVLAYCSPPHKELIELKRQGFTFPEIAARTGYHPSSVRRIVYDLIRRINREMPEVDA
jgi:RNA polymerase sigma factor (sigma-70 family)